MRAVECEQFRFTRRDVLHGGKFCVKTLSTTGQTVSAQGFQRDPAVPAGSATR